MNQLHFVYLFAVDNSAVLRMLLKSGKWIKQKSRLAHRRFSQKRTDEFDLFDMKSKKANKTNSSIRFLEEYMAR